MNALVTGATGFLGSHLCRRLVESGHDVTIFSRSTSNTATLSGLQISKKLGDITDAQSVLEAIKEKELVIHAAAHGAYWNRQKEVQNQVNIQGTKNVVDACLQAGVKKLIYISSMSAIGIPEDPNCPADEDFRFNLEDSLLNYHISKKRAEETVLTGVKTGLDATIVNPCSIWGQFGGKYRLEDFVYNVLRTKIVPYFSGGTSIVHVEDVVDGIVAAATLGKTGERYILGGENLSFKKIAEMIAAKQELQRIFIRVPKVASWSAAAFGEYSSFISDRRPRITFVTHYCASRFHYYDSRKARTELGFSPRDFKTILDECISFLESRNGSKNN